MASSGANARLEAGLVVAVPDPDAAAEAAARTGHDEAANLTAYLAGIGLGGSHWTLRQINQLLFLRQMNRIGHFAETNDSIH